MSITLDASDLVRPVLKIIPKPYGEDVTLRVFQEIEKNPRWLKRYNMMADEYSQGSVNQAIGKQTKDQTMMKVAGQGKAHGTTLISTYTKLTH
ncbi:MAG: hypothetical protein MUO40_07050 [Anaerolineaceae bacterium]|nr:hypothetical protein [Anaerolineaceae bacterium]